MKSIEQLPMPAHDASPYAPAPEES